MPKNINATLLAEILLEKTSPTYLIEITLDGLTLRYTDLDTDLDFPTAGNTYTAIGMFFDPVKSSVSMEVDRVNVSMDNIDNLLTGYVENYRFQGKVLTIKRVYLNHLALAANMIVIFAGEMGVPSLNETDFSVEVVSPLAKLSEEIPRRSYEGVCPWSFDGTECRGGGASLADEKAGQTAGAGSTIILLIDAARTEVDDYWNDGTIEMTSGANDGLKRKISDFDAATDTVTLLYAFPTIIGVGDTYTIKRGCSKSESICKSRFDNFENYGGFVSVPDDGGIE